LTVEENLRIVARPNRGWDLARVYDLFPRLVERRQQHGATLSGGEQQMLAIGRSLMTNPRLLLMDEPSEGLAPAVLDLILDRLRQIKLQGQAVLLAEQNVDLALEVADRVCILGEAGTIGWSGPPATLRDNPAILRELVGL
jgi:branched-chain amino acid transport system ATP-binding protein